MANATVTLIGDRLYAINAAISGVKARRYFPEDYTQSAMHPLLIALPGAMTPSYDNVGANDDQHTQTFEIILLVKAFLAGIPTQSAQTDAETLMDTVYDTYRARPLLEHGGAALDGVIQTRMSGHGGIEPFGEDVILCMVRFPILITTLKTFAFARS